MSKHGDDFELTVQGPTLDTMVCKIQISIHFKLDFIKSIIINLFKT